jgi:hypothetical protein
LGDCDVTDFISQLWLYPLCGGVLGLFLGWVIWGRRSSRLIAEARAQHGMERASLERAFAVDEAALEEHQARAIQARDEALEIKGRLIRELEGERRATSEAQAEINHLKQEEVAARGEFERCLDAIQELLLQERRTAASDRTEITRLRRELDAITVLETLT